MQKGPSQNRQGAFPARVAPSRHRLPCETIIKKYLCNVRREFASRCRSVCLRVKRATPAELRVEEKRFRTSLSATSGVVCASSPVASPSDENNESDDQNRDNQHPVLDLDAENVVRLNEVLHRARPFLVQGRLFGAENILFLYGRANARRARVFVTPRRAVLLEIGGSEGRAGQQSVEFRRAVADVVRRDDVDVPSGIRERARLGDCGGHAQSNRDDDGFAS
jgi:hypothetical protein